MKNVKKIVNHLAAPSEKIQHFKLPQQHKVAELIELTAKAKHTFTGILPDEVLDSLVVAAYDGQKMVISTTQHTVANHLNYTNHALLSLLHQDYPNLQSLNQLRFIVRGVPHSFTTGNNKVNLDAHSQQRSRNTKVKNVTSCNLSHLTRQNITHLAEDVTMDKRLATILQRLAE